MVELTTAFEAQAGRIGATVHRAARADVLPLATRILLEARCRTVAVADGVPQRPALIQGLGEAGLSVAATAGLWPTRRADAGISVAMLGVAETGSVLLASTADDRRVELCVDVHLVWLEAATLVPTLDGAVAVLRRVSGRPPAYATLVSGPSRSADIERQLTIGVHGPRALHILLMAASE
ncbi:MAG TPA: LUD domain-containing protein [Methylomirabilota bacterium]|jgi:L-lactate dehydrogenase complex protein LldG|nr:LUD domain-containing protein [Methylomirabilota bacterium]